MLVFAQQVQYEVTAAAANDSTTSSWDACVEPSWAYMPERDSRERFSRDRRSRFDDRETGRATLADRVELDGTAFVEPTSVEHDTKSTSSIDTTLPPPLIKVTFLGHKFMAELDGSGSHSFINRKVAEKIRSAGASSTQVSLCANTGNGLAQITESFIVPLSYGPAICNTTVYLLPELGREVILVSPRQKVLLPRGPKIPKVQAYYTVLWDPEDLPSTPEEWSLAQKQDPALHPLIDLNVNENEGVKQAGYKISVSGVLTKRDKIGQSLIVVPRAVRRLVLAAYHDEALAAHLGVFKTYRRIRNLYTWPNLRRDVIEYVRSCELCQTGKSLNHFPFGKMNSIPVLKRGPYTIKALTAVNNVLLEDADGVEVAMTNVDQIRPFYTRPKWVSEVASIEKDPYMQEVSLDTNAEKLAPVARMADPGDTAQTPEKVDVPAATESPESPPPPDGELVEPDRPPSRDPLRPPSVPLPVTMQDGLTPRQLARINQLGMTAGNSRDLFPGDVIIQVSAARVVTCHSWVNMEGWVTIPILMDDFLFWADQNLRQRFCYQYPVADERQEDAQEQNQQQNVAQATNVATPIVPLQAPQPVPAASGAQNNQSSASTAVNVTEVTQPPLQNEFSVPQNPRAQALFQEPSVQALPPHLQRMLVMGQGTMARHESNQRRRQERLQSQQSAPPAQQRASSRSSERYSGRGGGPERRSSPRSQNRRRASRPRVRSTERQQRFADGPGTASRYVSWTSAGPSRPGGYQFAPGPPQAGEQRYVADSTYPYDGYQDDHVPGCRCVDCMPRMQQRRFE
ncbi:hypothetical protein B566_EDAN017966 [Ephemera danica]|nr:hypothetical protein B566_EDAN017966 [Ephemera danica]